MAKHSVAVLAAVVMGVITGCASGEEKENVIRKNDAIDDYVIVTELKEIDAIRSHGNLYSKVITEKYIIVSDRRNSYLLTYKQVCRELRETEVKPDIRRERNVLRARFDTYRGCPIRSLHEITKGQADELLALGEKSSHLQL